MTNGRTPAFEPLPAFYAPTIHAREASGLYPLHPGAQGHLRRPAGWKRGPPHLHPSASAAPGMWPRGMAPPHHKRRLSKRDKREVQADGVYLRIGEKLTTGPAVADICRRLKCQTAPSDDADQTVLPSHSPRLCRSPRRVRRLLARASAPPRGAAGAGECDPRHGRGCG